VAQFFPSPHPLSSAFGSHALPLGLGSDPAQVVLTSATVVLHSVDGMHLFILEAGAVAQLVRSLVHVDPSVLVESHVVPTSVQVTVSVSTTPHCPFGTQVFLFFVFVAHEKPSVHPVVIFVQSHFCPLSVHLMSP
jgi:hypothetical protein